MRKREQRPEGHTCYRCGWRWMPRKAGTPTVCPRCHSPRWSDAKSDEELYWHWLEWAANSYWFDLFRIAGKVANGQPMDRDTAKALVDYAKSIGEVMTLKEAIELMQLGAAGKFQPVNNQNQQNQNA